MIIFYFSLFNVEFILLLENAKLFALVNAFFFVFFYLDCAFA